MNNNNNIICQHEQTAKEMIDTEIEVTYCVKCQITLSHQRFCSDSDLAIFGEI